MTIVTCSPRVYWNELPFKCLSFLKKKADLSFERIPFFPIWGLKKMESKNTFYKGSEPSSEITSKDICNLTLFVFCMYIGPCTHVLCFYGRIKAQNISQSISGRLIF